MRYDEASMEGYLDEVSPPTGRFLQRKIPLTDRVKEFQVQLRTPSFGQKLVSCSSLSLLSYLILQVSSLRKKERLVVAPVAENCQVTRAGAKFSG